MPHTKRQLKQKYPERQSISMKRIARFEKVSFEQYKKDYLDTFGTLENVEEIYENIK